MMKTVKRETRFKRLRDWESRFDAFVARAMRTRFEWGTFDCGLMAADAVLALTGEDVAADARGAYATAEEAMEFLGKPDPALPEWGAFTGFCDARLGDHVHPELARRGDIVLGRFGPSGTIESLMVDVGNGYMIAGKDGAIIMSKDEATPINAWRVG